ncbi:hydroxymethylglutaryl-CoA reductase, degradative [Bombilactobacillus bombi]|uniref:hydroxymethylglutaryl-CoA reductase, degradative n=1 Tax=Bombilactobacillus bombi TaxID=1303590 RepID=UPI0015E61951|nr:hydroxymethylglutaryl-CoA reductase, degradative [Bombilactobacillus bombi]MBA1434786.1 hydroxymethylglutaryl-CoA reductase, degradative [Bombilactobacillus bombi]
MTKFYQLTTSQRLQKLQEQGYLTASEVHLLQNSTALSETVGSHLIENYVGNFPLPLGLANHFVINSQDYLIPMVTEEPSVIAAASNAAQRMAYSGGITTRVQRLGINGQIVFQGELPDHAEFLQQHQAVIYQVAKQAHPTLLEHGGGLQDIQLQTYPGYVEFNLLIDPAAAMGANVVNTILEAVAHYLQQQLPQLRLLMAILSNHAPHQQAFAQARIDFQQLANEKMTGELVAQRIVAASDFAVLSPARAATHNKGIMNGVIAASLATGNDIRNVSAAVYAGLDDRQPLLTSWQLQGQQLVGKIKLNLPIGSVGGAISTLPLAQLALKILRQPTVADLMGIIASVGLASNLAALRALVTQGIQAGHMHLQWQSLALAAGAHANEIEQVVTYLDDHPQRASLQGAQKFLQQLRKDK